MGNKQKKSSGGKKKKRGQNSTLDPDAAGSIGGNSYGLIMVDPVRVRFQHSKIRPYFSGCGRSIHETLEDIKEGKTKVSDLPPIQVLVGDESMDDEEGPWYFSLNNRRLWVLKRLREDGNLEQYGNKVAVRVRRPKSQQEKERYTLSNCALHARLMPEKKRTQPQKQDESIRNKGDSSKATSLETSSDDDGEGDDEPPNIIVNGKEGSGDDNDEDESDDSNDDNPRTRGTTRNLFANMIIDDSSSSDDD
jgi:hypothetical protein